MVWRSLSLVRPVRLALILRAYSRAGRDFQAPASIFSRPEIILASELGVNARERMEVVITSVVQKFTTIDAMDRKTEAAGKLKHSRFSASGPCPAPHSGHGYEKESSTGLLGSLTSLW